MTTPARASELDTLIDALTVDAYGDDEQLSGFLVGAEEALRRAETARRGTSRCSSRTCERRWTKSIGESLGADLSH